MRSRFDGLIGFSDAARIWGLDGSTLRKAITYGRLQIDVDCKKFGRDWIITEDAMIREYGPKPEKEKES